MASKKRLFDLERVDPLFAEWRTETDRASGIMTGALLDELLLRLIKQAVVEGTPEEIFGFDAPLGTFSGRIKMAYAMGLISDEEYKMLTTIKDIRNTFAHSVDQHYTFETEAVRVRVANLTIVDRVTQRYVDDLTPVEGAQISDEDKEFLETIQTNSKVPRMRFMYATRMLSSRIIDRLETVKRVTTPPTFI